MTNPVEQNNGTPLGKITSVSADTGSQTTASFPRGNWAVADPGTIPKDDGGNPQWIVSQYNNVIGTDPNAKIYLRTGTNNASVTGGPAGMSSFSGSSSTTEYYLSNCAPGTGGTCIVYGTQSNPQDNNVATQNGVAVTENTVKVGTVNIKGGSVSNQQDNTLQYVQAGNSTTSELSYTISATKDGASWQQLPNGLFFNPQSTGSGTQGYFFTGTATPTTDMATLKSSQVTANYYGQFNGSELTDTTRRQLSGSTYLNANFGTGKISGNVSNMQAYSNCNGQCTQSAAGYNLNVNGTITGTQYSGTTQFATATTSPPTGAATGLSGTGNLVGGFFGPSAAETGGAVRVNGSAPGVTGTNTTVIGAYGAKKQ